MTANPRTLLDTVVTPEEIARRITASKGIHVNARTVWEKARRIGVAKKIGRSMLISVDDIPKLLEQEKPRVARVEEARTDRLIARELAKKKRSLTELRKMRLKAYQKVKQELNGKGQS